MHLQAFFSKNFLGVIAEPCMRGYDPFWTYPQPAVVGMLRASRIYEHRPLTGELQACSVVVQSNVMIAAKDPRVNAAGPTSVVAQGGYSHQITHDRMNPHRQEVLRRPADVVQHYVQADAAPSGSTLGHAPNVQVFSRVPRGSVDQTASMACETCSRPAMFVCSACRKAPYCSVECQVCCSLHYLHRMPATPTDARIVFVHVPVFCPRKKT